MRSNDDERRACVSRVSRTCRILLSDIALDSRMVECYPKLAVAFETRRKQRAKLSAPSCVGRCDGFSDRVPPPCSLRSGRREQNAVSRDERTAVMRYRLRDSLARGNRNGVTRITFESNDRGTDVASRVSCDCGRCNDGRRESVPSERRSASDAYSESLCSTSSDKTFVPSTCSSDRIHETRMRSKRARCGCARDELRFGK